MSLDQNHLQQTSEPNSTLSLPSRSREQSLIDAERIGIYLTSIGHIAVVFFPFAWSLVKCNGAFCISCALMTKMSIIGLYLGVAFLWVPIVLGIACARISYYWCKGTTVSVKSMTVGLALIFEITLVGWVGVLLERLV